MLNKKALRQSADNNPAPAIPPNHGLLHAQQVDYVIRTDIKIIARRRTLVLYIYDRERATAGNPSPVWTMFQAGGDYVTLARLDDGAAYWRTSSFERLGGDYRFTGGCAFYSARDEWRVRDFFRDRNHDGITALIRAQKAILDKRCQKRQRERERRTIRRMASLHTLPRGLEDWIHRDIMPAYFRCAHASARKPVTGTCTSCGRESMLPHAAHNSRITCPHCKRELAVKSVGKTGRHQDRDTVQVVEKTGDDEVAVRIVKVWYTYDRDCLMPKETIHENARIFVRRGPDGKVTTEPYYYSSSKGTLTHWIPGERPVFFKFNENFEASTYGHVYCRNLLKALAGTPWEYCPVKPFYQHFHEPMQMWPFLTAHLEHPKLEHLVKVGFYDLASDLAYGRVRDGLLDEAKDRTHRLLRVDAGDVAFLRELGADAGTLRAFQGYAGLKDRQRLLRWQLTHGVSRDIVNILEHVTAHKFMKYMDRQYPDLCTRKTQYGGQRYRDMQSAVSSYRDYLDMCVKLGYDMSNSFVLYPRDLQTAHDKAQKHVKIRVSAQLRQDFEEAMLAIGKHPAFEADGLTIVLPNGPDDIVAEGQALRTCVANYVDRVARRECVILFVRKRGEPDKPFYTVEVRNRKIAQVRGMRNSEPTPEVQTFMDKWERQVLRAA